MNSGELITDPNGYSQAISTEKMKVVQNADSTKTSYSVTIPSGNFVIFEFEEDGSLYLALTNEHTGPVQYYFQEQVAYAAFTFYFNDSSFDADDIREVSFFYKAT